MSDFGPVIVGSEPGEHFLSLARTKQGRIFRKQILRFGEMAHPNIPGKKLKIDENTADKLVENFKNNICPIVQVPVVDDANQHVEDPLRNIGEIIGVEKTEDGVDVILDARKHADDVGRTLIGASAFMHMDYCVDTQTEILTRRGWLLWDEVQEGDDALTINPETGAAEWSVIETVFRAHRENRDMVRMEYRGFSALTTPDHRWLVRDRQGAFRWTTTEHLNSSDSVPLSAPGGAATEAKYTDAFVELVAWFYTEGSFVQGALGGTGGQLSQSVTENPTKAARIERALEEVLGPKINMPAIGSIGAAARWGLERPSGGEWRTEDRPDGVRIFHFSQRLTETLLGVAPAKVPSPEFLTALTQSQLELFVRTSVDADGYTRSLTQSFFGQQDEQRTRAFEMACVLAGLPVSSGTVNERGARETSVRSSTGTKPWKSRTPEKYTGVIWCPTLRNHNWVARREGKVYFTGNTDTKTGKKVGPTLLHVAVTNRPYVTDLDEFKEEIAASADIDGEKDLILFSPAHVEEQKPMTKDEMIAALKKDHDLDVAALLQNSSQPDNPDQTSPSETPQDAPKPVTEEEAPKQDDPVNDEPTTEEPTPVSDEPTSTQELVSALANVLKTASPDKLELSKKDESKITTEDVANAVIEMAQDNVRLSATVQELKTKSDQLENERAEKNIDELISKGFVTPAQREGMLKLSVENPDLFKQVLPTNPIVSLSEDGVTTHEDSPSEAVQAKLDEIERLAEFAKNI